LISNVSDRYLYASMIAVATAVALLCRYKPLMIAAGISLIPCLYWQWQVQGCYRDTLSFAECSLRRSDRLPMSHLMRGMDAMVKNDLDRASESLEKVMLYDPLNDTALRLLVEVYQRQGHHEKAEAMRQRAHEHFVRVTMDAAQSLYFDGHYSAAAKQFRQVVEHYPHEVRLLYLYGTSLELGGDAGKARGVYEAIEKLEPGYEDVRERLGTPLGAPRETISRK
jgi:tetratricopeptide (TPR) repeat protein